PDIVVFVDAHGVRERPGVEVLADLADELAVGREFVKLRGGVAEGGSLAAAAARKDEDMSLRIDRDAGGLAEMHVGRQLQEVGHRLVGNLWHLLRERRRTRERYQSEQPTTHGVLPSICGPLQRPFSAAAGRR